MSTNNNYTENIATVCLSLGCGNRVEKSVKNTWKMYCSSKCRGKHNSTKSREKARTTSIEKYGVDNPFKRKDIQERMRSTMVEKYGVEYTFQSNTLKLKRDRAMGERYGNIHALNVPEFKLKKIIQILRDMVVKIYGIPITSKNS